MNPQELHRKVAHLLGEVRGALVNHCQDAIDLSRRGGLRRVRDGRIDISRIGNGADVPRMWAGQATITCAATGPG